ncbi:hypothetical protein HA466_0173630 [Hirschfeldia incana]|nr:hypothetical protein HA466_0173630 [Hirschfeldia incana]
MRRLLIKTNPVFFLFLLIATSSLTILIFSLLRLPESPPITTTGKLRADDLSNELGFFGNMMVEMLPEDLVFTAFVPSEKSFDRDLGMTKPNSTSKSKPLEDDEENTYAVVTRILAFSVVPYRVEGGDIGRDETASYESLSGFALKIWRKSGGGGIVVNGVETEKMGLKRGKITVHVMDGVIMDSDFAQSVAS